MSSTSHPNSSSENDDSKKDQRRPTWSQVESTRTKVRRQPKHNDDHTTVHCLHVSGAITESGFYAHDRDGSFSGRMDCVEVLTKTMAQRQLEQRINSKNAWALPKDRVQVSDHWANRWGLRWILKYRVFTLLGNGNIMHFTKARNREFLISDKIMDPIFKHYGKNKRNAFKVVPLDELLVDSVKGSIAFVRRVFSPGFRGFNTYVESWKSGSQMDMFRRAWADASSLGAFKSLGRAIDRYEEFANEREGKSKKP
ncbi:hypothetical protein IW140_002992 [Coemansia sp. RSA 1813]|nr:hypothetical protein EV178_003806 [Coemansia sp. RSA 1646]KAJ1766610.1 hypothetical protein LPJ74_005801 [Coemansia sp. RSA 1843]KAJ2091419.1 hypothetical protein IW138_001878 [Coemansia sp. RSA 986]KAJ2210551.1 hypothetical protein EV179_006155 [Coemansia sp. RSA 487]KAJ2569584.1 hypothetical protein IW140_002992 [Coemansia sp. RSA 1813]